MALTWPPKLPAETLDYQVNWTARLAGDTIVTSVWSIPAGLTGSLQTSTTTTATTWLAGGTAGTTYSIENTITTAAGRIMREVIDISVVARD